MGIAKETQIIEETLKAKNDMEYYDNLYNFSNIISKANESSFEGYEPYRIANTLRKSLETFFYLCMYDPELITVGKSRFSEKIRKEIEQEYPGKPEQIPAPEPQETKPLLGNFLRINSEGWGLCPACGTKILKVTSVTRLENFPVFCKRCKADHLVNWWNAAELKIAYKRYVSDSYTRNRSLKGTGLRSFQNTGSSATERAAMRL